MKRKQASKPISVSICGTINISDFVDRYTLIIPQWASFMKHEQSFCEIIQKNILTELICETITFNNW